MDTNNTQSESYKVLVVEDNPDTLYLLKYILESAGHKVLTSTNGAETMELIDEHCSAGKPKTKGTDGKDICFDLVIIDFDLPDITGGTLGEWIRTKYQDVALMILTGYGKLPGIKDSANRMGAELESKPIAPEELLRVAEMSVRMRRINRPRSTESPVRTSTVRHILRLASAAKQSLSN